MRPRPADDVVAPATASPVPPGLAVLVALAALGVATAAHLAAQLAGSDGLANVTQWLLMPLLAATLWLAAGPARGTRLVRLAVLALGFSWLGDTAPDVVPDDAAFVTMLGFFLVAHACYLVAFWPLRGRGVLGRRPALAVPYLVALVALLVVVTPGAGGLAVPVVVYGAVLVAVAVLATFDGVAAFGGALFVVSDALIALRAFVDGYALTGHGFWVMLTYVAAQALLAAGVLRTRVPSPETGIRRAGRRSGSA